MKNKQLIEAVARRLDDKPSVALRQALEDLEAVEKCGDYVVNMDVYHVCRTKDTPCQVCLAGAVLARAGLSRDVSYTTDMTDADTWYKLSAINDFRMGDVISGLYYWNRARDIDDAPQDVANVSVVPYRYDPERFKDGVRRVIVKLEELGE